MPYTEDGKWEYGTTMFDRMFGHWFSSAKTIKNAFEKKPKPNE